MSGNSGFGGLTGEFQEGAASGQAIVAYRNRDHVELMRSDISEDQNRITVEVGTAIQERE